MDPVEVNPGAKLDKASPVGRVIKKEYTTVKRENISTVTNSLIQKIELKAKLFIKLSVTPTSL